MRGLNRCRIFARKYDKTSQTYGRNSAADSDVEFLSNLISLIEFDTAKIRRMNRALGSLQFEPLYLGLGYLAKKCRLWLPVVSSLVVKVSLGNLMTQVQLLFWTFLFLT